MSVAPNADLTVKNEGYAAWLRAINAALGRFRSPLRVRESLSHERLIRDAKERARLTNFGDPSFEIPLRLLVEELSQTNLSAIGALAARETLLSALINRLEITHTVGGRFMRVPERPIFILGLHRSGTSWLQELLARDPRRRALRFWELMRPGRVHESAASRKAEARRALSISRLLTPEMRAVHPVEVDSPEECWALFMNTFAVVSYALHFPLPNYEKWLAEADLSPSYRDYAQMLGLFTENDERQLVLKCPEHLWCLPALFEVFPDACVVWVHRDPARSVASYSSLSALNRRTLMGRVDLRSVGPDIEQKYARGLSRAMVARDRVSKKRLIDVHHHELVSDPAETVAHIYEHFDLPMSDEYLRTLRSLKKDEGRLPHRYTSEQYGLDPSETRSLFRAYIDRYRVREEPIA